MFWHCNDPSLLSSQRGRFSRGSVQVVQLMGSCMDAAFEGQHLRTAEAAATLVSLTSWQLTRFLGPAIAPHAGRADTPKLKTSP